MYATRGLAALILAAGTSSRMGTLKPLLPLGGETVIEKVIGLFRAAGIPEIRAVLGHAADQIVPVIERQHVSRVTNAHFDRGMFSSVQAGVRTLGPDCRAFFLLPADMPFVQPDTVRRLAHVLGDGNNEDRDAVLVCRPCYQGRRGHPPLISSVLIPDILSFEEPGGLRALLARYAARVVDVTCDDPGILIDLDTPGDYMANRNATLCKAD